jgi:hypothetical protein
LSCSLYDEIVRHAGRDITQCANVKGSFGLFLYPGSGLRGKRRRPKKPGPMGRVERRTPLTPGAQMQMQMSSVDFLARRELARLRYGFAATTSRLEVPVVVKVDTVSKVETDRRCNQVEKVIGILAKRRACSFVGLVRGMYAFALRCMPLPHLISYRAPLCPCCFAPCLDRTIHTQTIRPSQTPSYPDRVYHAIPPVIPLPSPHRHLRPGPCTPAPHMRSHTCTHPNTVSAAHHSV